MLGKTEMGNKTGAGDQVNRSGRLGLPDIGDETGVGGY